MKVSKAPRVGEVLPHVRRHPQRDMLLKATDEMLRAAMAAGDMVAGLLLAMAPAQRVLLRARLKA